MRSPANIKVEGETPNIGPLEDHDLKKETGTGSVESFFASKRNNSGLQTKKVTLFTIDWETAPGGETSSQKVKMMAYWGGKRAMPETDLRERHTLKGGGVRKLKKDNREWHKKRPGLGKWESLSH